MLNSWLLTWVSQGRKVLTHQPPRRQAKAIEIWTSHLSDSDAKDFRRLAGTALYHWTSRRSSSGRNGKANSVASAAAEVSWSIPGEVSGRRVDLRDARSARRIASLHRQRLGCLYGVKEVHVFLFHQVWKTLVGNQLCKAKHSCVELRRGTEFYAITRGSAAGMMVQSILQEIRCKTKLVCLTDSSAAKAICHRRGVGRVKNVAHKELWVQDRVDEGELTVKKVGTEDGSRITQLIGMMPMKRGLVVASLIASAMAQGPEEQRPVDSIIFVLYMFVLHILALAGFWSIMSNGRRRFRSVESQTYLHTGEQEIQVEYTTETKEIQTREDQQSEPSAGTTEKAACAPNKISTVPTAQTASAPSSSSSVVTTSTPASAVPDGLRPRTQAPVTLPPTTPPDSVWIIGNSIRYHRAGCGMVRVQSRQTRHPLRSDAIRSGYTACQQCGG